MRRSCVCFCCWSGLRSITGALPCACACCGGWSRRSRSAPSSCPSRTGALEAQYQALVRALDADRRAQLTRSQQGYQELVEYYTVWAHQIKTPIAAMRLLLQDADTDEQRALLEQLQSVEQYVEMVLGYLRLESRRRTMSSATTYSTISSGRRCASMPRSSSGAGCAWSTRR